MLKLIGRIIGWTIFGALAIAALVVAIIFAGYIFLWVLGVLGAIVVIFGFMWIISKLLK